MGCVVSGSKVQKRIMRFTLGGPQARTFPLRGPRDILQPVVRTHNHNVYDVK